MQLRLSHKLFILVALLLVFELLLLGGLAFLLHRSQQAEALALRNKTVVAQANTVLALFYRAADLVLMYSTSVKYEYGPGSAQIGSDLDALVSRFQPEFDKLKQLVGNDPVQQSNLASLEPDLKKMINLIPKLKALVLAPYQFASVKKVTDIAELFKLQNRLMSRLQALVDYQQGEKSANPIHTEQARKNLILGLAGVVILNIVAALALAAFVAGRWTGRIERLSQNTLRLAAGQALQSEDQGSDEIAQLDRQFHQMAVELDRARQKEKGVVENALDVICTLDKNGQFTTVSRAAHSLWGYAPADLLGMRLTALISWEPERVGQTLKIIMQEKEQDYFECQMRRKDGTSIDMLWSVRWYGPDASFFCVSHDISQRKEGERLRQEFVSMVSHDLRTPLTSVSSCLALVQAGKFGQLDARGQEFVAETEEEVDRLMLLVNGLLDVARMEGGSLELETARHPVQDLIRRSINAVQGLARKKKIAIGHDGNTCEDALFVYGDGSRLVQVLVNLLSNAVKFSPDGSTVAVNVLDEKDMSEIRVTDQGTAIPAARQATLFEPFGKSPGRVPIIEGSGLGLSISKAIVEAHGGTIGVSENPDGGNIFWFRLPKHTGEADT
jgi:PAS domain S-box-containing protein